MTSSASAIKQLTFSDIESICLLDRQSFPANYDLPWLKPKDVRAILKHGFALGIFQKKQLVANIHVKPKGNSTWFLYSVATHPQSQGKGFAKKLLLRILSLAKKQKIKKIIVTIKPDNVPSLLLFLTSGFSIQKYARNYFGKGIHRLILELHYPFSY